MALAELFDQRDHTLSLEFFRRKRQPVPKTLQQTQRELAALGPDFMTVTYGAGGSNQEGTYLP